MSIRKPASAAVALAASIMLSACSLGGSDSDELLSDEPTATTSESLGADAPATPTAVALDQPVQLFPAVGQASNVVEYQSPTVLSAKVLNCAEGLETVTLMRQHGIEFNGTTLEFTESAAPAAEIGDPLLQLWVDVKVGHLVHGGPFNAVAMIVSSKHQLKSEQPSTQPPIASPNDDVAVNLTPDMITEAGLRLSTIDYAGGPLTYIDQLRFCLSPAKG